MHSRAVWSVGNVIQYSAVLASLFALTLARADNPPEKSQDTPSSAGEKLFQLQILPAIQEHCLDCHDGSSGDVEGGLELDSPSGLLRGGDSGPALVSHAAGESMLLKMLRHEEDVAAMPPEEKLSDELVEAFAEWIRLGAPDTRQQDGLTLRQQKQAAAEEHWAFQTPEHHAAPDTASSSWAQTPVDQFLLAPMEAAGLHPAEDADRTTLVRRLYFDLWGMPPSPEQVAAFLQDNEPGARERLVDQLLESPRFGERWARHWLDVVRYAESSGMEFNFSYPHAWPYRDYVIDAFNMDKPYDQFLREQIAGDLLSPQADDSEPNQQRLVATSVLSFGPKRHNSSGTAFRMDVIDEQIDTVFRSTMGLTVACARCHDHKFDPIPTRDYYALAGIFWNTEPLYGTIKQKYSNTPTDLLPLGPDGADQHQAAEAHEVKVAAAAKVVTDQKQRVTDLDSQLTAATAEFKLVGEKQSQDTEPSQDTEQAEAVAQGDSLLPPCPLDTLPIQKQVAQKRLEGAEKEHKQLQDSRPKRPAYAMSARDRAKPVNTRVAIRGSLSDRGDEVPRGFLSAVKVAAAEPVDSAASGRLQLAQWVSSSQNPLTARVMVNRVWQHLFGRGLVASVDNFGLLGKPPTHAELLDTLAVNFVSQGWSVKQLVRRLVLTRAYGLSSRTAAAAEQADPDNKLYWRFQPRRLEAEAIRDSILAVSGQLDLARPQGSSVTGLGDKLVRGIGLEKLQPGSSHRSVYLPVVRDYLPEIFEVFDFPSPSLVVGQRAVTNVPAQALYLRNSQFVATQAKFAAQRLLEETAGQDWQQRAQLASQRTLSRELQPHELALVQQLLEQVPVGTKDSEDEIQPQDSVEVWAAWFQVLFSTAEFRFLVDACPPAT